MNNTIKRRWLFGIGLFGTAASLLFMPATGHAAIGTARVLVNANICTYLKTSGNSPMQYFNSGIHNMAPVGEPFLATNVSCTVPFTVPYQTSPTTPNPAPFQTRIVGNDGDPTPSRVPPICNVETKDSSWNTLFILGDAQPNTTFGPWVIDLTDFAPGLPTQTHTVHCTVPVNSDLYAISAGVTLP